MDYLTGDKARRRENRGSLLIWRLAQGVARKFIDFFESDFFYSKHTVIPQFGKLLCKAV